MAQVCGGTSYDFAAQRKHDAALKLLSRAADMWARKGREGLSLDSIIAILLRIFLPGLPEYNNGPGETVNLEQWLARVRPAVIGRRPRIPSLNPMVAESLVSKLREELSCAVSQWVLGDPEQPPTAQALNAIEHILFAHKLATRPASPKLPRTVREASNEI